MQSCSKTLNTLSSQIFLPLTSSDYVYQYLQHQQNTLYSFLTSFLSLLSEGEVFWNRTPKKTGSEKRTHTLEGVQKQKDGVNFNFTPGKKLETSWRRELEDK